jgi:activator of HSP90 ATPase
VKLTGGELRILIEATMETIDVSTLLPASPEVVYRAWIDSEAHGKFTGSPAHIDPNVGGVYSAWDGYISGETLTLEPFRRIVQSWRTTDFPEDAPDSHLEVLIEAVGAETSLRLIHTGIPDGQSDEYRSGWNDYYFEPMRAYFAELL